jgi:ferredoxin-NADP reductase
VDRPPVNPYYLWHGILLIAVFGVLMPLTAFLILINRNRFYNVHKYIGVVIVVLLGIGWILTNPGKDARRNGNYASFAGTKVGQSHKNYGNAAIWIAVGVCALGVVLWFLKLPHTMRQTVRYMHGIVGVAISFFGPYVVWTGWVQLQPAMPVIPELDDTPWVWLSLALTLAAVYITWYLFRLFKNKQVASDRVFYKEEIDRMISDGKLVLVINGAVCEIPKSFSHPGGRQVLQGVNGQEVGQIMNGEIEFRSKNGNLKRYSHSTAAFKQALEFKIGTLAGTEMVEPSAPVMMGNEGATMNGKIVSMDQVNSAQDFPVLLIKILLSDGSGLGCGSRVNLSIPNDKDQTERPYTICGANEANTVEFCIKIYPKGKLTSKLRKMKPGQSLLLSKPLAHAPIPSIPNTPSLVVFLAGGTGVTPMIGYFESCSKIALGGCLMWWVRHEGDLFLVPEIEKWGQRYNVKIQIFFTQSMDIQTKSLRLSCTPKTGRVTSLAVLDVFGGSLPLDVGDVAWITSGPDGFMQATRETLSAIRASETRILSLD